MHLPKDIAEFLPPNLREEPIYLEVLDVLAYILNEVQEDYEAIFNKFKNFEYLTESELKSVVAEYGYSYIFEALSLSSTDYRRLIFYLGLVHVLKGHRRGLELVLRLLNGTNILIKEWWEKDPKGEPHTFDIEVLYLDPGDLTYDFVENLREFTRNYLYPVLKAFNIYFLFQAQKISIHCGGFHNYNSETESLDYPLTLRTFGVGFLDRQETGIIEEII